MLNGTIAQSMKKNSNKQVYSKPSSCMIAYQTLSLNSVYYCLKAIEIGCN